MIYYLCLLKMTNAEKKIIEMLVAAIEKLMEDKCANSGEIWASDFWEEFYYMFPKK